MNSSSEKAFKKSIAFFPREWEIIQKLSNHLGYRNSSGTLRYIVQQWFRDHGNILEGEE